MAGDADQTTDETTPDPPTDQSATNAAIEQATVDQPGTGPAIEQPTTDQPAADQAATAQATGEPTTDQPATDQATREPTIDQPVDPLSPRTKMVAIGLVNVLLFGLLEAVDRWGLSGGLERPLDADQFRTVAVITAFVCVLPLLMRELSDFGGSFVAWVRDGQGASTRVRSEASIWNRLLEKDEYWLSRVFRYFITVGTYVGVSVLVLETGGVRESPFQQFPIAVVLLAPIIMTQRRTARIGSPMRDFFNAFPKNSRLQNLVAAIVYIPTLYIVSELGLREDLPEKVRADMWVVVTSVTLIVLLSLSFNYLVANQDR